MIVVVIKMRKNNFRNFKKSFRESFKKSFKESFIEKKSPQNDYRRYKNRESNFQTHN